MRVTRAAFGPSSIFGDYFTTTAYHDVLLVAAPTSGQRAHETVPYRAHRVILAAASRFLDRAFWNLQGEAAVHRQLTLDCDPEILGLWLVYIYTGSINLAEELEAEFWAFYRALSTSLDINSLEPALHLIRPHVNLVHPIPVPLAPLPFALGTSATPTTEARSLPPPALEVEERHAQTPLPQPPQTSAPPAASGSPLPVIRNCYSLAAENCADTFKQEAAAEAALTGVGRGDQQVSSSTVTRTNTTPTEGRSIASAPAAPIPSTSSSVPGPSKSLFSSRSERIHVAREARESNWRHYSRRFDRQTPIRSYGTHQTGRTGRRLVSVDRWATVRTDEPLPPAAVAAAAVPPSSLALLGNTRWLQLANRDRAEAIKSAEELRADAALLNDPNLRFTGETSFRFQDVSDGSQTRGEPEKGAKRKPGRPRGSRNKFSKKRPPSNLPQIDGLTVSASEDNWDPLTASETESEDELLCYLPPETLEEKLQRLDDVFPLGIPRDEVFADLLRQAEDARRGDLEILDLAANPPTDRHSSEEDESDVVIQTLAAECDVPPLSSSCVRLWETYRVRNTLEPAPEGWGWFAWGCGPLDSPHKCRAKHVTHQGDRDFCRSQRQDLSILPRSKVSYSKTYRPGLLPPTDEEVKELEVDPDHLFIQFRDNLVLCKLWWPALACQCDICQRRPETRRVPSPRSRLHIDPEEPFYPVKRRGRRQ